MEGQNPFQTDIINQLQQQAAGTGASPALQALFGAANRSTGHAYGAAQGIREVGYGARTRLGADASSQMSADAALQSQMLKLQEQGAARDQLAQALAQMRDQNLSMEQGKTGFEQQQTELQNAYANQQASQFMREAAFRQDIQEQLKNAAIAKDFDKWVQQNAATDKLVQGAGAAAGTLARATAENQKQENQKKQKDPNEL